MNENTIDESKMTFERNRERMHECEKMAFEREKAAWERKRRENHIWLITLYVMLCTTILAGVLVVAVAVLAVLRFLSGTHETIVQMPVSTVQQLGMSADLLAKPLSYFVILHSDKHLLT